MDYPFIPARLDMNRRAGYLRRPKPDLDCFMHLDKVLERATQAGVDLQVSVQNRIHQRFLHSCMDTLDQLRG